MKHIGEIKAISLSPDGSLCVTGAMNYQSTDRNALVWDVPSLSVVGELKGHRDGIYASAWSPIGEIIATGGGGTDHAVRLWDATSRRQIGELGRDLFIVHALAFSPDGRFLLTGSANNAPVASIHDGSCFRSGTFVVARRLLVWESTRFPFNQLPFLLMDESPPAGVPGNSCHLEKLSRRVSSVRKQ